MKKLIPFITLLGFIITSQMQLVHAFDMMEMAPEKHHEMTEMKRSIFCETDEKTKTSQCTKELIPDKLLSTRYNEKFFPAEPIMLPIYFDGASIAINQTHSLDTIHSPPDILFEKSRYSNLIWIIKNLN